MYGLPPLFVLLIACTYVCDASGTPTVLGCVCQNDCGRTYPLLATPWCYTLRDPSSPTAGQACGRFAPSLNAYWDECVINVTSTTRTVSLTTLSDVWTVITVSTVTTSGSAFALAGLLAACIASPKRVSFAVPLIAAALGALQGLCVGGIFAVITGFIMLSLPYALEYYIAIALGVGLGVVITYGALGRQYRPLAAPHASEYNE